MKLTTSWQNVASYQWNHSSGARVTFYLDAKYTSQNIETNKTYIDTRLRSVLNVGSISGSGYNFTCSYCPTVSGSGVWNFDTETITSKSNQEIEHNADGTKSLTLTATMSNSYHGLNQTISGTVELPTIPRASSVSSSSPYIGDNATIIISSASTSFTHTLTYTFGSATGTIATKTSATTVAWDTNAVKANLYAQIPNAKSGTGTITCQTYSGNTLIGTKSTNFNLYAKESDCKPDISGTVVDTNSSTIALTGNSAVMVRYMSKPKVTISATAKYSSSISSYSINLDGQTINSNTATYGSISSNNITISVTDSRGYTNSKLLIPSMISYIRLTSNLTIERPEQTSSEAYLNGGGEWFNGNFSSSNANTLSINCEYRKSEDSEWTSLGALTPSISGNTFRFSNLKLGSSFDYKNEYQFRITIADKLETIGNGNKDIITLSTGTPIVRIGKEEVIVNGGLYNNDEDVMTAISSTQPTTNPRVWFKKGKNLLDMPYTESNKLTLTATRPDHYIVTDYKVYLEGGKTYTLSFETTGTGTQIEILLMLDKGVPYLISTTSNRRTFSPGRSGYYYVRYDVNTQGETHSFWNFQIEAGNEYTGYEPYSSEHSIYVKEKNGEFREFNNTKEVYSTSEQRIGTWIDGKPLYRKCFTLTDVPTGYHSYKHNILNLGVCIKSYGTLWSGSEYKTIPCVVADNIALFGIGIIDIRSNVFHILMGSSIPSTNTVYAILEYTKTTD